MTPKVGQWAILNDSWCPSAGEVVDVKPKTILFRLPPYRPRRKPIDAIVALVDSYEEALARLEAGAKARNAATGRVQDAQRALDEARAASGSAVLAALRGES